MAHSDAWEGKWRGNWRMEWVASTLHTISEHGVSSIRLRLKCGGTRAETIFRLQAKLWRIHLNRRGRQFTRLLEAEVCASAVVMLGTPCSEVVWRLLATHNSRQFPRNFLSRASPCAITFQTHSTRSAEIKVCLWTDGDTAMGQNSVGQSNFAVMFPVLQMLLRNFGKVCVIEEPYCCTFRLDPHNSFYDETSCNICCPLRSIID
jgi:hypothetical protein